MFDLFETRLLENYLKFILSRVISLRSITKKTSKSVKKIFILNYVFLYKKYCFMKILRL